ncbi:hypothetical protein ILUMI_05072 [Ignelater luminosus]|uniref:Uncharacterized protein n=1 Tax=Ignelater luminosus TaxID=2038154 RepID=A0A8K0D7S8_IGNLU|nr:hypothetical protein ILUMI_05072 [Ignelater luminosus]
MKTSKQRTCLDLKTLNAKTIGYGIESTVSTRNLAPLPSIDENGSDPIEILSSSQEQDCTQVFPRSDPISLQNSPCPTVATALPRNVPTPPSATTQNLLP